MIVKCMVALLALGALTGLSVLTAVCISAGSTWTPVPSDCIVVLGAHVWMDGRLSNALAYRCEAALKAWQEGIAPVFIVCGAQGSDEPTTEAQAMRDWLVARGVPEDRVIPEPDSRNTAQNLQNARTLMSEHGFSTCAVCTNNYHLRRALWLARDLGLDACGIGAPSTRDPRSLVRGRLRETCSWMLYFVRRALERTGV